MRLYTSRLATGSSKRRRGENSSLRRDFPPPRIGPPATSTYIYPRVYPHWGFTLDTPYILYVCVHPSGTCHRLPVTCQRAVCISIHCRSHRYVQTETTDSLGGATTKLNEMERIQKSFYAYQLSTFVTIFRQNFFYYYIFVIYYTYYYMLYKN